MTIQGQRFGVDIPEWGLQFPRIRLARANEMDVLMQMCRSMHAEHGKGPAMDADLVRQEVMSAFYGTDRRGICAVIGDVDRIEGSIMLFLNHLWYNRAHWLLEDRWLFVSPEFRKADNTRELLSWACWISDSFGVPLCMSILSGDRSEAKMRIYRRVLGPASGGFFWREPNAEIGSADDVQG